MKTMILVILTAAITNNYVLVKFLGICPFLGVSKKLDQASSFWSLRPLSSWSRSFSSAMCPRFINPSASICRSLRRTAACWA